MKYEVKSLSIFNPVNKKLEKYDVEIHLSKRNNNTFEIKIPSKTKLPNGLKLKFKDEPSYDSLMKNVDEHLLVWNNQVLENSSLRIKKIFFRFNAGISDFDGILLSNKEFFGPHTPNDKYHNGAKFYFDYIILDELKVVTENNLNSYKKYFTPDGELYDAEKYGISDYRSMEWSKEKEIFFQNFKESITDSLKRLGEFLEKDENLLEVINKQKLLGFNID